MTLTATRPTEPRAPATRGLVRVTDETDLDTLPEIIGALMATALDEPSASMG